MFAVFGVVAFVVAVVAVAVGDRCFAVVLL